MDATPSHPLRRFVFVSLGVYALLVACSIPDKGRVARYRWWSGLGPVLPHDTFPADCSLCHEGDKWHEMKSSFEFDHERETGVPLEGAHAEAMCLRCHNDRGPVAQFQAHGCVGCHRDMHYGELGKDCTMCHNERDWRPVGQIAMHNRTRFPLVGAHLSVSCNRCHPGSTAGNFVPTDNECLTCHTDDLAGTTNPPHIPLGWVDNCDRCHFPIKWRPARTN